MKFPGRIEIPLRQTGIIVDYRYYKNNISNTEKNNNVHCNFLYSYHFSDVAFTVTPADFSFRKPHLPLTPTPSPAFAPIPNHAGTNFVTTGSLTWPS